MESNYLIKKGDIVKHKDNSVFILVTQSKIKKFSGVVVSAPLKSQWSIGDVIKGIKKSEYEKSDWNVYFPPF